LYTHTYIKVGSGAVRMKRSPAQPPIPHSASDVENLSKISRSGGLTLSTTLRYACTRC